MSFLVNGQHEPEQNKDTAWLFQPELSVRSAHPEAPDIFIRKPLEQHTAALDPIIHAENQAMAMLYRNQVEFAVGHGVGVHAELVPDTPTRAICLSSSIIPNYEVPATKPPTEEEIPALKGLVLDMKRLSEASDAELQSMLEPLTTAYQLWIEAQAAKLGDPNEGLAEYQEAAEGAIANCRRVLARIEAGLATMRDNPQAAKAFRFMNQAMWQQRIHSAYSERRRRGESLALETVDVPPGSRSLS